MSVRFRDPLVGDLMGRPICHGYKSIGGAFVPISPEEREKLIKFLEREAQDMVCTSCGSTKQARWLQIVGMMACCDARHMVPAVQVIEELAALKAGPPVKRDPSQRVKWIAAEIAEGRAVNSQSVMRQFGVGRSTAATDIAKFMAADPAAMLCHPAPAKRK